MGLTVLKIGVGKSVSLPVSAVSRKSGTVTISRKSREIRWAAFVFAMALGCALRPACAQPGDLPISAPRHTPLNPCFSVQDSSIRLLDGSREQAVELICGGILTWDIPRGASSFHVTLWRSEPANGLANSQAVPTNVDPVRVLIRVDGKPVADTILRVSTPAEEWVIPTNGAAKLSIETEQEYGAFGVYLGSPGFSQQSAQASSVRHVLSPGRSYANLGSGPRQVAFFDFHPGETVPIQAEFAGNASHADVLIRFSLLAGGRARTISVPVTLHADGTNSVGSARWQVPPLYGPANVQITTSINGRQVYSDTFQVALAKAPDPAAASISSNFGIHHSTSGSLFLQDDEISLWGAKWVRFYIAWNLVEAKQGQYDWEWIDNVVQSYSSQHLALLGVMGELPPRWITDPASQMKPAYAKFVEAALQHFKGKIDAWEAYNEIDSKFYAGEGFNRNAQPTGDIDILRQELDQMQRVSPRPFIVCCAPGGSDFLPYEKRIFDAGLIGKIDAVAMHPYQAGPPEESDLGLTYVEMADRLAKLAASYGKAKPVWATEANWLIGPADTPGVTAPQVTEHEHSQYLVRANLLSLGIHVPYFSHSAFFYPFHRNVFVDSLASYAQMTAMLSNARDATLLSLPPHVFGISATALEGTVTVLWTDSFRPSSARVSGLAHLSVQDMYGNSLPASGTVQLSGSPIYLIGQGNPRVSGISSLTQPVRKLPPFVSWKVIPGTRLQQTGNGAVHVTSLPSQYGRQLESPVLDVTPGACYVVQTEVAMHKGGLNAAIVDPDAKTTLRNEYIYTVTGNDLYKPEIQVKATKNPHLQIVFTDANSHDAVVSDFEVGSVTMSDCP
jgi:hypothetical protein